MRYTKPVQFRYAPGSITNSELEKLARVYLSQLQATLGRSKSGSMIRTGPNWTIRVSFALGQPVVDIATTPKEEPETQTLTRQVAGIIARPRSFSNPHGWGPPFEVAGVPTTPPAGTAGNDPPHDVAVYEFNGSASRIKRLVRGVDNYEYGNINIEQMIGSTPYLVSYWGYQSRDVVSSSSFSPSLGATYGDGFNIRKGFTPFTSNSPGKLDNTTYGFSPFQFYINGAVMNPAGPGSPKALNGAFVIRKTDGTIWARWAVTVLMSGVFVDELWEQQLNTVSMTLIYATLNKVCTLSDATVTSIGSLSPNGFAPYAVNSTGQKLVAISKKRVSSSPLTFINVVSEWTFDADGVYTGVSTPYESSSTTTTTTGGFILDNYEVQPAPFTSPSGIIYGPGEVDPTDKWLIYITSRTTPDITTTTAVTYIGAAYGASDTIVPLSYTTVREEKSYYDFRTSWNVIYHVGTPSYPDGVNSNVNDGFLSFDQYDVDEHATTHLYMESTEVANGRSIAYSRHYGTRSYTDAPTDTYEGNEEYNYIYALYADLSNRDCFVFRVNLGAYTGSMPPPVYTIELGSNTLLTLNSTTNQTSVKPVISAFRDKQTGLILVSAFIAVTDISGGTSPNYLLVCEKGNFFAAPAFIQKVNTQDDDTFLFPIGPYRAEWVV